MRRARLPSPTAVLLLYAALLYAVPAPLIVAPLGAAGTPAQIVGGGLLAWWVLSQLIVRRAPTVTNPVHWLLAAFAATLLAAYVAGASRPISAIETSSADRALITLCAWMGVALVVSDGLATREDAFKLIRGMAGGGVFIAVLGLLQFYFGLDLAALIKIPGLTANSAVGVVYNRSGYARVAATTSHPIEFGVVLASLLPIVVHCARFSPTLAERRFWWVGTAAVAGALPVAVGRSGMLGGAIAILLIFPALPPPLRGRALVALILGAGAMTVLAPGLLGTIRSLIFNAGNDPSAEGRTADYPWVIRWVVEYPLNGRGLGTLVQSYRTLDNQYLAHVVETGLLGLFALLLLLGSTMLVALYLRRSFEDARHADLAQMLVASVAVIAVDAGTFDAFAFPICVGNLFLFIGLVGWLWRVKVAPTPIRRFRAKPPHQRWAIVLIGGIVGLSCLSAAHSAVFPRSEWRAIADVTMLPPGVPDGGAFSTTGRATLLASVLHDVMDDDSEREHIRARTPGDYSIAVGNGSLIRGSDRIGFGPSVRIQAVAATPDGATAMLDAVLAETERQLHSWHTELGIQPVLAVGTDVVTQQPFPALGRPSRAKAGVFLLGAMVGGMWLSRRREVRLWRQQSVTVATT
jgi:hypothetical protein